MTNGFRNGFYGGLSLALVIGLTLFRLWQPERQVRKHVEILFHSMEKKDWKRVGELVAADYEDQWNHDRARLLERSRLVFAYLRAVKIHSSPEIIRIEDRSGIWKARINIETEQSEIGELVKQRVNSLTEPFEMRWRHESAKPWDWKLVRVENA